jgi:hypothetical protein
MPETNTTDKPLPDPQQGGRYERNADGSLKTLHQTEERDIAKYANDKAKRQAGEVASETPADAPAAPNDDHAQE